jgi:uncharacterized membrane protein
MSNDEELRAALKAIQDRLGRLEKSVFGTAVPTQTTATVRPVQAPQVPPRPAPMQTPVSTPPAPPRATPSRDTDSTDSTITHVLGWGGAVALVLAAAYIIRLAIDAGWLTPTVQVACAGLLGLALIAAGFALKRSQPGYAGLLPAAGIAILFLCAYGAHLLYHLVGAYEASAAVIAICVASLGLCVGFDSDLYALFAVVGSYSAPFLLPGAAASFGNLALYYSAWSLTFTAFAIARGRRAIYLVALYAALIGFDALARSQAVDWRVVLAFQAAQFVIFGVGVLVFSIRHRETMGEPVALLHLPALVLFYALQYFVLQAHLPHAAPWIALGTLLAVALLYLLARLILKRPSPGGQVLLGAYAALVLFHAGYLQSVPHSAAPWVALALMALVLLIRPGLGKLGSALWPLLIALGVIVALNLLRVVYGYNLNEVSGHRALGPLYAAMLYLAYVLTRREIELTPFAGVLLYTAHITAISATLQLIHERILQSVTWALLALGCMIWSLTQRDKVAGQSSLLLFGAAGVKVMLYDLGGAAPVARIFSLLILGVAFYVGGMLYQRMAKVSEPT